MKHQMIDMHSQSVLRIYTIQLLCKYLNKKILKKSTLISMIKLKLFMKLNYNKAKTLLLMVFLNMVGVCGLIGQEQVLSDQSHKKLLGTMLLE